MEKQENKLPEDVEEKNTYLDEVQQQTELAEKNETEKSQLKEDEPEGHLENHDVDDPEGSSKDKPEEATEEQRPEVPAGNKGSEEVKASETSSDSAGQGQETDVKSADDENGDNNNDEDDEDDHHQNEEQKLLESLEFEDPEKEELYAALKKFSNVENMRILDKALKEIRPHYDKVYESEQEAALKAFKEEGNEETDFAYKGDEVDQKFFSLYESLRNKKQKYFSQLVKSKEDNLQKKNELLEKLRELVDGEESTTSINALKELQEEWRKIGPVPGQYAKSLWANYNALIDRFYDHRSIYFELKELDRRKNLEAKLELCERAEALDNIDNIKDAIFQLNELHEEFKHIGPVPKEEQEPLWQRFKGASDKIYAKRKDYFEHLKKDLSENAEKKKQLGDLAEEFASFTSDRIGDWNKKTKEILELQKQWDAIGGLPREQAKNINKHFWGNFKKFFGNKNVFFKSLEGQREENLKKKQELLEKAEALKDSTDWGKTAGDLKKLQSQWREIGPVPEKYKNELYKKFKSACDRFFEKKREKGSEQNKGFEENLKRKEEICSMLEAYMNSDTIELEEVYDLMDQYAAIGFVPRHAIKKIHDRYDAITNELLSLEELTEEQLNELKAQVQVSKLKNSPHGSQKIHRKENAIKRKVSTLENDISTYKTNIEFFASSKNADQLKDEFNEKIEKAEEELEDLKKQLDVLKQA